MKSSILLLIAMMVIFAGCGQEKKKDVSGSCRYTNHIDVALGGDGRKCYITTDEAACSVLAKGRGYSYTIGGSCSN